MTHYLHPLHKRKDLLEDCCELLNREWKRSYGLRSRMLEQSCNSMPISLVLVEGKCPREKVIGHARLCNVVGDETALCLQSVVIESQYRGKGLGKKLVEMTHDYLKNTPYKCVYLRTDIPQFYEKIGYKTSEAVETYHNTALGQSLFNYKECFKKKEESDMEKHVKGTGNINMNTITGNENQSNVVIPAPPPPPLQFNISNDSNKSNNTVHYKENGGKSWLKINLNSQ